jgi:hypothetical protein
MDVSLSTTSQLFTSVERAYVHICKESVMSPLQREHTQVTLALNLHALQQIDSRRWKEDSELRTWLPYESRCSINPESMIEHVSKPR